MQCVEKLVKGMEGKVARLKDEEKATEAQVKKLKKKLKEGKSAGKRKVAAQAQVQKLRNELQEARAAPVMMRRAAWKYKVVLEELEKVFHACDATTAGMMTRKRKRVAGGERPAQRRASWMARHCLPRRACAAAAAKQGHEGVCWLRWQPSVSFGVQRHCACWYT